MYNVLPHSCKSMPDRPIMQQMRVNGQVKTFLANYRQFAKAAEQLQFQLFLVIWLFDLVLPLCLQCSVYNIRRYSKSLTSSSAKLKANLHTHIHSHSHICEV